LATNTILQNTNSVQKKKNTFCQLRFGITVASYFSRISLHVSALAAGPMQHLMLLGQVNSPQFVTSTYYQQERLIFVVYPPPPKVVVLDFKRSTLFT